MRRWLRKLDSFHTAEDGAMTTVEIIMIVCVSAAALALVWGFFKSEVMAGLRKRVGEILGIS